MQYRINWSASSNISFHSCTDWEEWDDPDADGTAIEDALLSSGGNGISEGLEQALEASGFEWWIEVQ